MSTHATITVKQNGLFLTSYVHYDGYPSFTLKNLNALYRTKEDAIKLIEQGDQRLIAESFDKNEPFGDSPCREFKSLKDIDVQEFNYIFNEDTNLWEIMLPAS